MLSPLRLSAAVTALCIIASNAIAVSPPYVVLAWDNTGDFGPNTPNTRTAGWQEAVNHCVEKGLDLFVKGGWGGTKAIYHVSDTITIPATQDFRIDGGVYVVNWTGAPDDPTKDLMVIDSVMNGEYHFGIFVYGGAGAAMRIRPVNPVPIDGFAVVVETEIKSQGMADPNPFKPGERKAGSGLVLDGSKASITASRFDFIGGILNFQTCVEVTGAYVQNDFSCLHLHTNADKSTLMRLGPKASQNTFALTMGVDMKAADVTGIVLSGFNNTFDLRLRGGFPDGKSIVLASPCRGNRFALTSGSDQIDLNKVLTDNADKPTNTIRVTGSNLPIQRVKIEPGDFTYTQRLFPATVRVDGGQYSKINFQRDGAEIDVTPAGPIGIVVGVGDALTISNSAPPELVIVPFAME